MDRFGSDKPDLRFGMELTDVTEVVKDCGFGVFTAALENGGTVRGINAKGQGGMPRKKIDKLVAFAKDYGAKGLAYVAIQEDGTVKSSFAKFMTEEQMDALIAAMNGEAGDLLLFAADKNKVVWDTLGALRIELAKQMELFLIKMNSDLYGSQSSLFLSGVKSRTAMWQCIIRLRCRWKRIFSILTVIREESVQKAYDIVLNGNEIGGGSVRIFQDDIQEKMFHALGFTDEQAYSQFGFLLDAFKYGVPPHAGLAYGMDRMVMLMAKSRTVSVT